MAHVIVEEDLYDADYVKEQTDLPFLVRDDDGRFLRESDLVEGGAEDKFYFWNAAKGRKELAAGSWGSEVMTLELADDQDPALEGAHEVRLVGGKKVRVRPVFELLRARLAEYTPERAAEITGVPASNIRCVARELAAARSSMILSGPGACKHYHSDLFQRGMVYLMALTGNSGGKPGSGIKVANWWPMPGFVLGSYTVRLNTEPPPPLGIDRIQMQDVSKQMFAMTKMEGRGAPLVPWLYAHDPKFAEVAARDSYADPALPSPVSEYMKEIFERSWQPVHHRPPKRPRFLYYSGLNPLRRWPNARTIRESLWKSIDTIVTCDFRMSTSGMWSDYILPCCGYYEKPGIKYVMSNVPYVIVGDRAVEPLYESKHEWDVIFGLARKIQERARARGIESFTDRSGTRAPSPPHLRRAPGAAGPLQRRRGDSGSRPSSCATPITRATDLGSSHGGGGRGRNGGDQAISPSRDGAQFDDERLRSQRAHEPVRLVRRAEEPVADAHRPPAVLHRPRVVPGGRRAARGAQGAAPGGWPVSAALTGGHAHGVSTRSSAPTAAPPPPARTAGRLSRPGRRAGGEISDHDQIRSTTRWASSC
jgi:anaerobic selenocysteine-containing dehydrogenase